MKKFFEYTITTISILILVWFTASFAEITFTEKGHGITPEYSKTNIIIQLTEIAKEIHE